MTQQNIFSALVPSSVGSPVTMSSREIAELVESNHADVRRSIERLAATVDGKGNPKTPVITLPPLAEVSNSGPGPKTISVYHLCKRDSLIVVAQLCPEFTARIIDRWQELEARATMSRATHGALREELEAVDVLARILNVAPSGKIFMVKASLTHHGAAHLVPALPVYAIDAKPDAYQKVLEFIGDRGVAGASYRTIVNGCRAFRALSSEKRKELLSQMDEDGACKEAKTLSGRGTVFLLEKHVASAEKGQRYGF